MKHRSKRELGGVSGQLEAAPKLATSGVSYAPAERTEEILDMALTRNAGSATGDEAPGGISRQRDSVV